MIGVFDKDVWNLWICWNQRTAANWHGFKESCWFLSSHFWKFQGWSTQMHRWKRKSALFCWNQKNLSGVSLNYVFKASFQEKLLIRFNQLLIREIENITIIWGSFKRGKKIWLQRSSETSKEISFTQSVETNGAECHCLSVKSKSQNTNSSPFRILSIQKYLILRSMKRKISLQWINFWSAIILFEKTMDEL